MPDQSKPAADSVHRVAVQMRFADTDALGHVNNGSYIVYAETGRLEFLRVLGAAARSLILAHISADFRKQVLFGAKVEVETWVERVGNTSVTLMQHVLADGALAAEVRSVVVSFDYGTQRPTPWSAASRAALEAHVHAPASV
ncbi:MAG TPA: thioesterase family protein [Gemmatimonadaceae bacterium]|nr:thioesterase family protein [Gemmatimonadaceae bacterium]